MTNREILSKGAIAIISGCAGAIAAIVSAFWTDTGAKAYHAYLLSQNPSWVGTLFLTLFAVIVLLVGLVVLLFVSRARHPLHGCDLVEEGGYYMDRKRGHAICPKCAVESGQRVGMMKHDSAYQCRVCLQTFPRGKWKL